MKHYYYHLNHASIKRGYNRTVTVFEIDKNKDMRFIGESHENSASWKGAQGVAGGLLAEKFNYRFDGYNLTSKSVALHLIYTG